MNTPVADAREINELSAEELLPYAKMLGCDFIWIHSSATEPVREPIVSGERAVEFVNSGADGIFVPCVEHWVDIEKGDHIGDVIDPATGRLEEYVTAPCSGREIMIVPCVNFYSMNIGKRFWTMDNTDINRMFPGYDLGETTQRIADGLFKEIQGYTYGVQLASFYQQGDFLPHVKLMETGFTDHEDTLPMITRGMLTLRYTTKMQASRR